VKAFLDNFAAILGSATVALLLMSVSHEYGYFWAVGSHFQAFLSTSDYFSNAVLWLPAMLLILYGFLDWDVVLGLRRYAPISLDWNSVVWIVILFVFPITAFFFLPFPTPYLYVGPAVILWLMYGTRILPFSETDSEVLLNARRVLIVAPVVMAVLFGWGFNHGLSDLQSFAEPYTLETKNGDKLPRIVLRTFDKGVLLRDAVEDRIEFVKWDEVKKISRLGKVVFQPFSCAWLKINCGTGTIP
jgi:hypothetical protein